MSATAGRNTKRREHTHIEPTVNSAATIYAGTMVALLTASGLAVPGGTASSGNCVGVAEATVTGDGTEKVRCRVGCFQFGNSADTDEIAAKDIGAIAYLVDDQTVALTDSSGTRKIAGAIADVDDNGVWVQIGPGAVGPQGPQGEAG
jgi:hypothetical protein